MLLLKNLDEIKYYIIICKEQSIGRDLLREKIKNNEYNRLSGETEVKVICSNNLEVKDLILNSVKIRNLKQIAIYDEKILHNIIIDEIESFMKEVVFYFSFIGSEYKIKVDNRNYFIDFLLYNIKYKCYVVMEFKIT